MYTLDKLKVTHNKPYFLVYSSTFPCGGSGICDLLYLIEYGKDDGVSFQYTFKEVYMYTYDKVLLIFLFLPC